MHPLRREVELPARLRQRAWFYLGLASFLFSLSIISDAALWARPTVAASRAAAAARLRARPPCRESPSAVDMREFHDHLMRQLEHPWAGADDLSPGGRYGNMEQRALVDGAPGHDQNVIDSLTRADIAAGGADPVRR